MGRGNSKSRIPNPESQATSHMPHPEAFGPLPLAAWVLGCGLGFGFWDSGFVPVPAPVSPRPLVLSAQVLLDRVVARVNEVAITLSDVRVATALRLVQVPRGEDATLAATRALIERRLMLLEVERFAPPEPEAELLEQELAALRTRAGSAADLEALMRATGLSGAALADLARDSLRIQAYLGVRFGTVRPGQTIEEWVRDLRRRAVVTCSLPDC